MGEWAVLVVGVCVAVALLARGYAFADRKLRRADYRHVVLVVVGFYAAAIVSASVTAMAGTPHWTVIIPLVLTLGLVSLLAARGALQVRAEPSESGKKIVSLIAGRYDGFLNVLTGDKWSYSCEVT